METFHGHISWARQDSDVAQAPGRAPVRLLSVDPEISTPISCAGKSSLQHAKPQRCQEAPGRP